MHGKWTGKINIIQIMIAENDVSRTGPTALYTSSA